MVKEKIRKALEDAVGYYNDGMSANDAVVKSASEHDLTVDQTDRVVESFNTAKTINYFDKSAGDRTGSFDLASKKDVTLALFGKNPREKQASALHVESPEDLDTFYFSSPDRSLNRKHIFTEKKAAVLDILSQVVEEKWKHGYSDHTIQEMASDAYSTVKCAEKDITDAIGTIDSYLWTATEKIASAIAHSPYGTASDKADMFKVACPHKLVIDEVSRICPLLKRATGGKYVKMNVVDTTPVDDILKEAEDIMSAVSQRKIYRQKKAEFHEKGEKIKAAMARDPSMSGKIRAPEFMDMIHAPEKKAQAATSLLNMGNVIRAITEVDSRKSDNEQLRDQARGAMLSDLLANDPILQDADPRQVASIYKSIVNSSPRVSMNKEVVRSVLRGAVNSIAISPADMKVLTDVDKGVQVAFGGLTDQAVKDEDQ